MPRSKVKRYREARKAYEQVKAFVVERNVVREYVTLKTSGNPRSQKYMPRDKTIAANSPYLDLDAFEDQGLLTMQTEHIVSLERSEFDGNKTVGLVLGFVALFQLASGLERIYGFFQPWESGFFYGPFVNRNHFAGLMVMLLPVGMAWLLARARTHRRGSPHVS